MTEAVKLVTLIDIIFILLLVLSGSVSGFVGEIVYYVAFIVPIAIGFYSSRGLKIKREEIKGVSEPQETLTNFSHVKLLRTMPLIAPTVAVVFSVSLLTSLLLSLAGISGNTVKNENIAKMILVHAISPALFEEALFRYIPMKLLLPYSKRWCIIYSALCFSLIHCSFAAMPYAFIAGAVFMAVDIALDSVWPSVILHLLNNLASVIWIKYCSTLTASLIFISVILVLAAISVVFIFIRKKEYHELFCHTFDRGEGFAYSYAPALLAVISCCIAAMSL